MRDQAEVTSGVATATHDVDSGALYIITLSSSTAPVALEAPAIPELTGLALFRSKRVEDGRDRFRLHLGYFDSVAAAEAILAVVRRHYPAAWVGPAPTSGMGSLDDTSVTQFKFIRAPKTIVRDERRREERVPASAAPVPAAPAIRATLVARATPTAAVSAKPVATPARPAAQAPATKAVASKSAPVSARSAAMKAAPARATQQSRVASPATRAAKPAPAAKQGPTAQRNAVASRPAQGSPQRQALPPRQVLNLLESGSPRGGTPAQPPMQPVERAAVIGAIQRFAVQIVWSMDPVDLAQVPKLAIFDAYTLYKVQVDRAGRRWYGLRLGFFSDPVSARQVALYARSDFSAAAVVPVSDRECERAEQAAITEFPQVEVRKIEDRIPLFDEPATPARSRTPSTQRPSLSRKGPAPAQAQAQAAERPAKKPRAKTTQEMADELVALQDEPDFSGSDPLNDTGVRHLAVNVVKKSRLSSLFHIGSKDKDES
jgi:hypothetical protein